LIIAVVVVVVVVVVGHRTVIKVYVQRDLDASCRSRGDDPLKPHTAGRDGAGEQGTTWAG
jgi:hypothetical protein